MSETFRDRIESLSVMTAERALADVHRRFCADDAHDDACRVLTEAVRQRDVQYRAAQALAARVAATTLTATERAERGRMAMDFPSGQLVYSLTDVEMILAARTQNQSVGPHHIR